MFGGTAEIPGEQYDVLLIDSPPSLTMSATAAAVGAATIVLIPTSPSPADVWEELRSRSEERAILLAGHEPLMSSIAAFLLASPALQVDMKKAALVRIDCDGFGRGPRGVLKWMLTPAVSGD